MVLGQGKRKAVIGVGIKDVGGLVKDAKLVVEVGGGAIQ
jgi:hypothetical protein